MSAGETLSFPFAFLVCFYFLFTLFTFARLMFLLFRNHYIMLSICRRWFAIFFVLVAIIGRTDTTNLETRCSDTSLTCVNVGALGHPAVNLSSSRSLLA